VKFNESKSQLPIGSGFVTSCGGEIRTPDLRVMHPTSAFAAPSGFVVWTFPSPFGFRRVRCLPSSLYTFSIAGAWLGITTAKASPTLTGKHIQVSLYTAHRVLIHCAVCCGNLQHSLTHELSPTSCHCSTPRRYEAVYHTITDCKG
jgi:hypothetical protein